MHMNELYNILQNWSFFKTMCAQDPESEEKRRKIGLKILAYLQTEEGLAGMIQHYSIIGLDLIESRLFPLLSEIAKDCGDTMSYTKIQTGIGKSLLEILNNVTPI